MQGILIVDKPTDWTSFDVIAKLRGILGSGSVPETAQLAVDFSKVTFIDDSYFRNCKALQGELDLSNVQYIGYHAFSGCTGITKLIGELEQRGLVEKRADVMRRYRQVLAGKERDYA